MQSLAEFYEDEDLQVTIDDSARIQRAYEKYFDLTIINSNYDKSFEVLRDSVDALSIEHQWVPINWIYNSDWSQIRPNQTNKINKCIMPNSYTIHIALLYLHLYSLLIEQENLFF